ncbi:MAG: protein translocase subunit SecD, partial [Myxococcota bacterium]
SGTQDLIVTILSPNQRYEVANYKNVTIPTNLDVKDAVRDKFGEFYAALFDRTVEKNPGAVVTEYAWSAGSCDPCPGPTLQGSDFATLGADGDYWSGVVQRLVDAPPAAGVSPLAVTVTEGKAGPTGGKVTFGAPLPEGVPFAVLTIDGAVAGVALPDGTVASLEPQPDLVPLWVSGPMAGSLGPVRAVANPTQDQPGAVAVTESVLPDWLVRALPNTAIPLGLDLQGGIDLTLQVEVDEAVLGQVSRDLASLKAAGEQDGVKIDEIRRLHSQPVLEITTAATLSQLQDFMRKRAADYVYHDSEGTTHRFEMTEVRQENVRTQAVEQVLETLRKRIDGTGVKDPSIVKKSGGRINIQLPGMEDVQTAVATIGTQAVLEFRMRDHDFDPALLQQFLDKAKAALPPDQFLDDELLNNWLWDNKLVTTDRIVMWEYDDKDKAKEKAERGEGTACGDNVGAPCAMALKSQVVLSGNDINDAGIGWDQNQQAYVSLEFKPRGGQVFCDVTGEAVGKQFAIILDQRIMSAPNIREQICGGRAQIEMSSADDPVNDAKTLANVLRTGALDAPVVIASKSQVGATLGADAIREGTIAALVGSVLVYVFMVLWYRTSGVIADIALTCNVLMVLACLGMFGATLTLPGIAGIALTVGMAVDSNIIVYERIREELRLGVHPRKAVDVGFEKALVAILDANITTAIAGIVLYSYGSGPVKGFAVTLLIGIVTTLITAVFVTRTIMELMTRSSATRLRI